MPARPDHGVVAEGDGGGWRRGTNWNGRTEYGRKVGRAKPLILRRFNSRTGQDFFTANGRDYYAHNRQKFIINLPCKGYIAPEKANKPGDAHGNRLLRSSFFGHFQQEKHIPMTEDALTDFDTVPAHTRPLTSFGLVRDQDHSREAVETALRRAVREYLDRAPKVDTVDGDLVQVALESTIIWCFDPAGEITFDEEVVRHLHADETPLWKRCWTGRCWECPAPPSGCTIAWGSARAPAWTSPTGAAAWSRRSSRPSCT